MYANHLKERLAAFAVTRRDIDIMEERRADFELETAQLGVKIDALKVVVTKVEGEREKLKSLVKMMTRERSMLCGRRDDLSREGERNRANIAGLIFVKVQD